jgi:hypothetical protein
MNAKPLWKKRLVLIRIEILFIRPTLVELRLCHLKGWGSKNFFAEPSIFINIIHKVMHKNPLCNRNSCDLFTLSTENLKIIHKNYPDGHMSHRGEFDNLPTYPQKY